MSVTPIWWAGAEFGAGEMSAEPVAGATITDTAPFVHTGDYAFRTQSNGAWQVIPDGEYAQMALSGWVSHGSSTGATFIVLLTLYEGADAVCRVRWQPSTNTLVLHDGSSNELDSTVVSGFAATDFFRFTLNFRAHASAGWIVFYLDDAPILSFAGNTAQHGAAINRARVGSGGIAGSTTVTAHNWDDLVWWDTTGESTSAAMEDVRLEPFRPNAVGTYSEWTPNGAGDNYTKVNEAAIDDDTTFNGADSAGLRDSYGLTNNTMGESWYPHAVLLVDVSRKLEAHAPLQTRRLVRLGADELISAPAQVNSVYQAQRARFTVAPDGGIWTQDKINNLEIGIVSAGTFT